jgi:hypothetical protein
MCSLCYSIQLLPSLSIRTFGKGHTVAAGSPFGFGPLFFGPVSEGKSLFGPSVNIPETALGEAGDDTPVLSLEAGKGQSLPYDLE